MSSLYVSKTDFLDCYCKGMTPEQAAAAWKDERDQQQQKKARRKALRVEAGLPFNCPGSRADAHSDGEATSRMAD